MDVSNNQVKLLSLTMKLNINYDELRAQILENAAKSGEAPENEVYFALTPAQLMNYSEGKDQYVMLDLSNKIYVKPEDAQNYVSATDLMKFLSSYGIVDYDQLQKSYDALFSGAEGAEGIALQLMQLQNAKPSAADSEYWSEQNDTVQEKVFVSMVDKVVATLDNISNYMCSCVFDAIAQMLAYTDVASVTDEEINAKFEEMMGVSSQEYLNVIKEEEAKTARLIAEMTAAREQAAAAKAAAAAQPELAAVQPEPSAAQPETAVAEPELAAVQPEPAAVQPEPELTAYSAAEPSATIESTGTVVAEEPPVNIEIVQDEIPTTTTFTTSTGATLNVPVKRIAVTATFKDGTVAHTSHRPQLVYDATYTTETSDRPHLTDDSAMRADKAQINSRISSLRSAMYAASRAERLNQDVPLEADMTDLSEISATAQRLFSNYKIDENGAYALDASGERQLKSLRQKIVDTYYIAQNYTELDISPGETENNRGDVRNKETDVSVRGAIKSARNDIQKALGAQGFDTDKYLADYADWADKYAQLAQAYDAEYENLQQLQEFGDAQEAQWYTNVWNIMGGEDKKLGEDVQMNIVRSDANHPHARGNYSNELRREFVFSENSGSKLSGQHVVLDEIRMNDEVWLKKSLENGTVRLERYINQKSGRLAEAQPRQTQSTPPESTPKPVNSNPLKEYDDIKKLTRDDKSFESFL